MLEFAKTESWTVVQRAFRRKFGKKTPEKKSIVRCHGKFITDGCLCQLKEPDAPQFQKMRLNKFELLSSRAPINRTEEPVGNFSVQKQLIGVS